MAGAPDGLLARRSWAHATRADAAHEGVTVLAELFAQEPPGHHNCTLRYALLHPPLEAFVSAQRLSQLVNIGRRSAAVTRTKWGGLKSWNRALWLRPGELDE